MDLDRHLSILRSNSGMTLVEVLLAAGILGIVVTAASAIYKRTSDMNWGINFRSDKIQVQTTLAKHVNCTKTLGLQGTAGANNCDGSLIPLYDMKNNLIGNHLGGQTYRYNNKWLYRASCTPSNGLEISMAYTRDGTIAGIERHKVKNYQLAFTTDLTFFSRTPPGIDLCPDFRDDVAKASIACEDLGKDNEFVEEVHGGLQEVATDCSKVTRPDIAWRTLLSEDFQTGIVREQHLLNSPGSEPIRSEHLARGSDGFYAIAAGDPNIISPLQITTGPVDKRSFCSIVCFAVFIGKNVIVEIFPI